MDDIHIKEASDLATQLLNSKDSKVAAAAKRIFSNAIIAENSASPDAVSTAQAGQSPFPYSGGTGTTSCPHDEIPSDIREAASAVAMLDSKRRATPSPNPSLTQALEPGANDKSQVNGSTSTATCVGNNGIGTTDKNTATCLHQGSPPLVTPKSNTLNAIVPVERKKPTSQAERLHRSRERNKMHARKTRQRKKEQMKTLEIQVEDLKNRQIQLKLQIEEKNTANILVELYKCEEDGAASSTDPFVEELLKRSSEDIPDASKIPELPALILPGQHSHKRKVQEGGVDVIQEYPDDGIDYKLLSKDRSTCSQEELDKIRRERNRMHAKRTRDRKRIFMEEMENMIKQLEGENKLLEKHLETISDSRGESQVQPLSQSQGQVHPHINVPLQPQKIPMPQSQMQVPVQTQSPSGTDTPLLGSSPALEASANTPTMDALEVSMLERESSSSCSSSIQGKVQAVQPPSMPLPLSDLPENAGSQRTGVKISADASTNDMSSVVSLSTKACDDSASIYSQECERPSKRPCTGPGPRPGSSSLLLARWS